MKLVIIDYGSGNLFSVQQAFRRLGITSCISASIEEVLSADKVIFPGVGHAASAMLSLQKSGLDQVIPQLKQPVLGICLGMQLLCASTEEGNLDGLGVFRSKVVRFNPENCLVPHMGWNDVVFEDSSSLHGAYYFVHSFKALTGEDTWATCGYENGFSAALKRANFWGVQFHPEKSGKQGELFLQQFLNT